MKRLSMIWRPGIMSEKRSVIPSLSRDLGPAMELRFLDSARNDTRQTCAKSWRDGTLSLVAFGLLGLTTLVSPGADAVFGRASLDPTNAWVGQRVLLYVDVLAADGWAKITVEPDIDVNWGHVIRTESQGTRLSETLNGVAYSGQRYEYSLFPRRAGSLSIPALKLAVAVTTYGAGGGIVEHARTTPPLGLDVKLPAGATSGANLVSTSHLKASQVWEPAASNDFEVGRGLVRSVTVEARDVSAMVFTPLLNNPIDGVGLYPAQPKLSDQSDRGDLTGTRVEKVTYMFQREGTVVLPPVHVEWFDVTSETLKQETLDGLTVTVTGAATGEVAPAGRTAGTRVASILSFTLGGAALIWVARRRLCEYIQALAEVVRESEWAYFHAFRRACHSGDSFASWNHLVAWLDRTRETEDTARVDRFLSRYGDPRSRERVAELLASLSRPSTWQGAELYRTIATARSRRSRQQALARRTDRQLPPLNP